MASSQKPKRKGRAKARPSPSKHRPGKNPKAGKKPQEGKTQQGLPIWAHWDYW